MYVCMYVFAFAADRCGHGFESTVLPEERSPVFLQFLDALWQLQQQFPSCFEFNESLLLFLADHLHTALFGNFLCNCSKERMELGLVGNTRSIWEYVLQRKSDFSINVCMYVLYVCMCVLYVLMYVFIYLSMCVYCMYVCMYVCIYLCVCTVCMYVCIYVFMYLSMYVYSMHT